MISTNRTRKGYQRFIMIAVFGGAALLAGCKPAAGIKAPANPAEPATAPAPAVADNWMSWQDGVDLVAVTDPSLTQPNVIIHVAGVVHTPFGTAPSGMVLYQPDGVAGAWQAWMARRRARSAAAPAPVAKGA